jgi:tetraacyldisaccharide 4'-kinase
MPVARSCHQASKLRRLSDDTLHSLDELKNKRVFALSSLGNPGGFERTLIALGATIVGSKTFRDHHRYTREDIELVDAEARDLGADLILTTEKDAIKINNQWFRQLEFISLLIELEFIHGELDLDGCIKKTCASAVA